MDRAWLNNIKREKLIDPEESLRILRSIELDPALTMIDSKVRNLRTNSLRRDRELREACLFCYGMSHRIRQPVWVYPIEDSDFDFVAVCEGKEKWRCVPVQLKELVPDALNSSSTLQSVLSGLAKYPRSTDLTVTVHLNRSVRFEPNDVVLPSLNIGQLWLFGAASDDQSEWFLYGDMLDNAAVFTTFNYPTGAPIKA